MNKRLSKEIVAMRENVSDRFDPMGTPSPRWSREVLAERARAFEADALLVQQTLAEALEWWHSIPSHFSTTEPAWVERARAAIARATSLD